MNVINKYNKFWVALATALTVLLGLNAGNDPLSLNDGIVIALSFLGSLGVYAVPNKPQE